MDKINNQTNNHSHSKSASLQLGRLFHQIRRLERSPRSFGEAGLLTPSEIHTIDAIGYEGCILMKELAKRLSITKGAVTQTVSRLESKDLVQRASHPEDSRAVIVSLTEKGKNAYRVHEELHSHFLKELSTQLSQKEIDIFIKSIDKLVQFLEK